MSITQPTIGAPAWGPPLNAAVAQLAYSGFNPNDHGLITWAYDPVQASGVSAPASGTIRLVKLPQLVQAETITSVALEVGTAATGGVAGQNFVGLYTAAGTRVAQSADCTTALATTGNKVIPLTSPYVASPGRYYVAILTNATTPPALALCASNSVTAPNFGLAVAAARFANGPTAQTTLPATITMSGITPSLQCTWVGVA
ncbi:hypothetical protein [Streptomyces hebeiensis]